MRWLAVLAIFWAIWLPIRYPVRQALAQSSAGTLDRAYMTPEQVQAAISTAVQATMPLPASSTPPATALDGATGVATQYARADHTHAARVQRTVMMTDASGLAKFAFARPIVVPTGKLPPITYMVEDAGTPVVVQIVAREFTTANGQDTHTSVTVKAQRSRTLPATLVALGPLVGYDVFGVTGSSVRVNLFAADPTQ